MTQEVEGRNPWPALSKGASQKRMTQAESSLTGSSRFRRKKKGPGSRCFKYRPCAFAILAAPLAFGESTALNVRAAHGARLLILVGLDAHTRLPAPAMGPEWFVLQLGDSQVESSV